MSGRADRPAVQEPLVAAQRDASYYDRPDTRSVKVWHIATTAWTGACQPGPEFTRAAIPLSPFAVERSPNTIYDDLRCQRPGCRVWWALVTSKPRRVVLP